MFRTLRVSRTLLLPRKAMEKRLEAKPSISTWSLSRYCLGKAARELGILQLFYLCTCLCALCSSAGDSSVPSGTACIVFYGLYPSYLFKMLRGKSEMICW